MIVVLALVIAVVWLLVRRRRRKQLLAGLNSNRPVFHADPPARRLLARSREVL